MSLKIRLISFVTMLMLALSMMLVGVYAASQTINLKGSVQFDIADTSLYVKDIRLSSDASNFETIDYFVPGYVNQTFNLNLGEIASTTGVVIVEIDLINTTQTDYTATCDSTIENASIEVDGVITGDEVPLEDILTSQTISGTITLTISYTGTNNVNLDGIVLNFVEYVDPGIEVTLKGNYLGGYIIGEGNTDIVNMDASTSNPVESTIYVPANTKICIIIYNFGLHEFDDYVSTIDWSTENKLIGIQGIPDPSTGGSFTFYFNDEEIASGGVNTGHIYYYVIINITEQCTIKVITTL